MIKGVKGLFLLGFATIFAINGNLNYSSFENKVLASDTPIVAKNTPEKIDAYKLHQKAHQYFLEGIKQYELDRDKNQAEFQKALELWHQSLTIYEQIEDTRGQIACLKSLATTYSFLGENRQA
nr:hypothetical protein [Prochloraceae cyanobacterium]